MTMKFLAVLAAKAKFYKLQRKAEHDARRKQTRLTEAQRELVLAHADWPSNRIACKFGLTKELVDAALAAKLAEV